MKSVIAFFLIASTVSAQSIVTSGGNRSIVTSGAAAVVLPKPTGPTEAGLLRMEIDFLKSSLAAATSPKPVVHPKPAEVPAKKRPTLKIRTATWCSACRSMKADIESGLFSDFEIEYDDSQSPVGYPQIQFQQDGQWRHLVVRETGDNRGYNRSVLEDLKAICLSGVRADILGEQTKTKVRTTVQSRSRLPVVRTRWGKIDLETYHKKCNCEMCQGIRALQRQYRQQYNPTSMPAPPAEAEFDFADIGQDPTPDDLIDQAVNVSNLQSSDVLADPGCGDGRVLIAYVKKSRCRGIGVEIDPIKADEARANIAEANLADRISVITGDALDFDPSAHGVTAIFVHLYDDLLEKLAPKFRQPGIRVVVTPYHQVPGLTMQQHGDVWVYRPTAIRSSSGLFGHIGTSHESRETLVNHLMTEGEHRGRHSAGDLARMSDEQLDALHSRDHALLN